MDNKEDTDKILLKSLVGKTTADERLHKNMVTWISEIVSIIAGIGIVGLLIQVGEYKANFKTACDKIGELRIVIDANASENKAEHTTIHKEIGQIEQAIAARTGRPIQ